MKKIMAAMAIVAAVAASMVLPANAATAAFGYQGVLVGAGKGEQTVLSCPSSMRGETPTIYLKPLSAGQKFFRIRQE